METMKMIVSTCCSTSRSLATQATEMMRRFVVTCTKIMLLSTHKKLFSDTFTPLL